MSNLVKPDLMQNSRRGGIFSAVIPTRNRHKDLAKAVTSICYQTQPPDELIIVDQSAGEESRILVEKQMLKFENIKLIYVHDPLILGLVDAKRVATERAGGDIICFLEDDVILEADFIEQIENGFVVKPEMLGCCGIITNPPNQTVMYEILFQLFHRGIFKDIRVGLYGRYSERGNNLIASEVISGGLSAWRKDVFKVVPFDVLNGFHMFEDIDFSTRVVRQFGKRLFINPNARLAHYFSPIGRDYLGVRQRRKLKECFLFYKKRKNWGWAMTSFVWLLLGMLLESFVQSLINKSFDPVCGYLLGFIEGAKTDITG